MLSVRRVLHLIAALAAVGAAALTATSSEGAQPANMPPPLIESWAPGVFDGGACPSLGAGTVRYRVDATVLLPLLFTAMPIASRENVGVASFSAYDCVESDSARLRAFEFFAGSFPDRARGLNRLGFLREAIRLRPSGPVATAQFGVISANREESVEEVERAAGTAADAQPYSFISGVVGMGEASNAVVRATLGGRWTSAADLYREVRPLWDEGPQAYSRTVPNGPRQRYAAPVGFLGAMEISLRGVAAAVAKGGAVGRGAVDYVHNGNVYRLNVTGGRADERQKTDYLTRGLVSASAAVWRVEYRIADEKRNEVETFRVWVELPRVQADEVFALPIVPLAFEFRPRAFLELRAVRVLEGAADVVASCP